MAAHEPMTKVLLISSRFLWPPFSGDRLRGTIWLDALAPDAEVALVAPSGNVPPNAPRFRFFPAARSLASGARGVARVLRDALPLQTLLAAPYRWTEAIARAEAEAGPFDATVVLLSRLDPWIRNGEWPGGRHILDAIDSLRRNTDERASQAMPPLRWFWRREERLVARAEGDAARAYDRVLVVSDEDLAELGAHAAAISNGVVVAALEERPRRFDFGFWGRLAYFANADAAHVLLDEIWPRIRQRRATATLAIGGSAVPKSIRRKANRDGVTLISPVDHMPEFARDVRVAVFPLRYGSGESTKTMEAAEAGCAIVGMPKAFRGVSALAAHARVASAPSELADAAVALLDDERERTRMAHALRDAVVASHARETTLARLAAVVAVKECA
jgi:glycosyltransferase involved in cell wall biosynthesis